MARLTIHDLDARGVLGFDLSHLLRALAPRSLAATWTVATPDESSFEATGLGSMRLEQWAESSAQISGDELLAVADETVQVIWGDFAGALPDQQNRVWLIVRAVDSSFFEVETSDQDAISAIKASFTDVRVV